MLAYSLNKNLKNLKISDQKKKRPKTAGRTKPPRSNQMNIEVQQQ